MKKHYFDISTDIELCAEQIINYWLFVIIGGRNTGKTYSALKYFAIDRKECFVFVKRTMEDVKLLCDGSGKLGSKQKDYGLDLSPFKAINRDFNTNIKAFSIDHGLGAFYACDPEGEPEKLIGYIIALSAVQKFKGFDLSDAKAIIFDEFIPQPWERYSKEEGNQLLDLYKTVSRDREHRGEDPLKLILLANATRASNPILNEFELTDPIVRMQFDDSEHLYMEEKGIFIHLIKNAADFDEIEENSMIYKAFHNTAWGEMAFNNKFGYDDFSNVERNNMKGFTPICSIDYKRNKWYIYQKEDKWYMTDSKTNKQLKRYNLNRESDQIAFYRDYGFAFYNRIIEGNGKTKTYRMYDIIMNYRRFFRT